MRIGWVLFDLLAIVAFTLIGIYSHHGRLPSWAHFLGVFLPFTVGWYGLAFLTRLYTNRPLRGAFWLTWFMGCAVGVMLYSWVSMERPVALWSISVPFWVLSTLFIGLATGAGRAVAWAIRRSRMRPTS